MPNPYEVLCAMNAALKEFNKKLAGSLGHDYTTDGSVQCFGFAGAMLDYIERLKDENTNKPIYRVEQKSFAEGAPDAMCRDGSYFYVALMGDPSECNHAFTAYFNGTSVLIIQVFVNKKVKLITWLDRGTFSKGVGLLKAKKFLEGYKLLFSVDMDELSTFSTDSMIVVQVT